MALGIWLLVLKVPGETEDLRRILSVVKELVGIAMILMLTFGMGVGSDGTPAMPWSRK